MNLSFPDTISSLRKEKGISQKQAAKDLGISQALLSHYEKGLRECGLDFVVRTADYYGVTTDYLLGRSSVKNNNQEYSEITRKFENFNSPYIILCAILKKINSQSLTKSVVSYLNYAMYKVFRVLLSDNIVSRSERTLLNVNAKMQYEELIFSDEARKVGLPSNIDYIIEEVIDTDKEKILKQFVEKAER